uniref:Peptidase S8/S53 domain-containing protein n=1 Tax=Tetradesmus obliquus TaxID=3088 RepID=A0A383WEE7_TETOB|eukprot:jgi/Sobl393_1/880/SZX75542.1
MILVHIATVHASAQVHLPLTHTAVDRTSFIVKFDEALIAPVSISAVDSSDDDTEAVRAAAQQLADAAATAAARIAELARQAGIDMQVVDTYGHVMTGMAVKVATAEEGRRLAQLLKADSAVAAVHPVFKYQVQKDRLQPSPVQAAASAAADPAADPALTEPEVWGGADRVTLVDLAQSAYSGEGIRVAVVDDGLDYTHPAFGSCTGINSGGACRVVAGYDFTDEDTKTYDLCGSHGTHVAGIIGGDSTAHTRTVPWRGVAYKASLGAYRVFSCQGFTQNSWLLSALERAVKDRMSVINLSMGTSWTAPLGLTFTTRLARQGVLVAAAAGNSGDDGLWTYGSPASEPDSFAVGSTDNTFSLGAALVLDTEIRVRGQATNVMAATARALMQNPLFSMGRELVLPQPRSGCDTITNKAAVAGKVVLVSSGECSENDKAINLIKAGAASVVFYDNRPYPAFKQSMNIDESIGQNAPQMFCVDQDTGLAVTKLLAAGKKITVKRVATKKYLNPNADHPSWFSSWGPDAELRMLPTFSAPGGGLLSSIPGNNFALYQGTSMATPYATGALALWRHANAKKLGSGRQALEAAKTAFITTAAPIKLANDTRFAHSVVQAGAGMIQVSSAITNTITVTPSYLSLPTGTEESNSTLTFTNTGSRPCAYQLGHTPAVSVSTENAWYEKEEMLKIAATVKFTTNTGSRELHVLHIQPGETVAIKAVVTTSEKLRAAPVFYSGYLTLTPIQPRRAAELEATLQGTPGRRMLQETLDTTSTAAAAATEPQDLDATDAEQSQLWFPPLSIPYLSLSQKYSSLSVLAERKVDVPEGRVLVSDAAYLCSLYDGSCAMKESDSLTTDPFSMEMGSHTFALPLTRPVRSAYLEIYNADSGALIGSIDVEGPIPWGGPKGLMQLPEMVTGAYWAGEYAPANSSGRAAKTAKLGLGTYRFVLVLRKHVAVGDRAAALASPQAYLQKVDVLGRLTVTNANPDAGNRADRGFTPIPVGGK